MPVRDYEQGFRVALDTLLRDDMVSSLNKEHLIRFLKGYKNVSFARKRIFVAHIHKLLRDTTDIEKDMMDRDLINSLFERYETECSRAYYGTIVNVSLRFVRWIYDKDGQKPTGFKDIKNIGKGQSLRNITPEDMLSWEDAGMLAAQTNSIQMKAILYTQLDGGFRPSEFVDLNYGDIQTRGKYAIVRVRKGKTGSRDVLLYHAVPRLQAWLTVHPTKKPDDPLWMIEDANKSHPKDRNTSNRYTYTALKKRLLIMAEKAGFGSHQRSGRFIPRKPLDFYNLRHSACTLAKLENLNPGLASDKFGHSIEYYEEVYGRLGQDDLINRFAKAYGDEEARKKSDEFKTILCQRCGKVNESTRKDCEACGSPLTMQRALETTNDTQRLKEEIRTLRENQKSMVKQYLKELLEQHPDDLSQALQALKGG